MTDLYSRPLRLLPPLCVALLTFLVATPLAADTTTDFRLGVGLYDQGFLDRAVPTLERVVKGLQRVIAGALGNPIKGAIHNSLGDRLLTGIHQIVHELGDDEIAKLGVP